MISITWSRKQWPCNDDDTPEADALEVVAAARDGAEGDLDARLHLRRPLPGHGGVLHNDDIVGRRLLARNPAANPGALAVAPGHVQRIRRRGSRPTTGGAACPWRQCGPWVVVLAENLARRREAGVVDEAGVGRAAVPAAPTAPERLGPGRRPLALLAGAGELEHHVLELKTAHCIVRA